MKRASSPSEPQVKLILLVILAALPCGYFLAQMHPLVLVLSTSDHLLLHLVETIIAIGFCMGIFALVATLHTLYRMHRRLHAHQTAEHVAIELAKQDELTGLPNRRKLDEDFNRLMDMVEVDQIRAVFMLDIDGFKPVNDVYGHGVGDQLLTTFATRLTREIGDQGLVARLGGDEFAIITPVLEDKEDAVQIARRVIAAIRDPFEIDSREIRVGTGIGIALFPRDGHSASELLRRADIALYRAKTSGSSNFRFFELAMDATILQRSLLEQRIRRAMSEKKIEPEFQPIVRLQDGMILGFEALARWHDPEFGSVPPREFIPIAEDVGLISELTEAILVKACKAARRWPNTIGLSLNISALKLQEQTFPLRLAAILAEHELLPHRLMLDITEPRLLRHTRQLQPVLEQLCEQGVRLALDDFGIGTSSLTFLRAHPFDTVKIHGQFSGGILDDPEKAAVVEAILILARGMGIRTVAEGIEDPALINRLQTLGCHAGQGHVFGPAVSADVATKLAARGYLFPASPDDHDSSGAMARLA